MPVSVPCPLADSWQVLLERPLSPEEQRGFEQHLEECATCQARLDRTLEGEKDLLTLVRLNGDPRMAETAPELAEAISRLRERNGLSNSGEDLALVNSVPQSNWPEELTTLGGYELREVLGRGGMGVVLKAYDPALQRVVALKVMPPTLANDPTARRRFTREVQAAAAVCHDHVVAIFGVHEAEGVPYLVMQYVPGGSLQDWLNRTGPLAIEEIVRIGWQTALGLSAAHGQGLIHRDIKPANLLLEAPSPPTPLPQGQRGDWVRVKITDFGLARMVDEVSVTQNGVIPGTPEYMAPEQARGEPIDHRADLFSLGSVLYTLCTGRSPFRSATPLAVLRQVNDDAPIPIRDLRPEVPVWLETFISRLMAKDPSDRFQSAAEVASLLESYDAHVKQPELPAPHLEPLAFFADQGDTDMVQFACSDCGVKVRTRTELAGKKVKCPRCGQILRVPEAESEPASKPRRGKGLSRVAILTTLAVSALLSVILFRASMRAHRTLSYYDRPLGLEALPGIEEDGFSSVEKTPTGLPFRWTTGLARLIVPVRDRPPVALHVFLHAIPHSPRIQIRVNGRTLLDETISLQTGFTRLFDLSQMDLGKEVMIELESETFIPARDGKGAPDERTLGVALGGITLMSGTRCYNNVPLAVVPLPEVVEEGFSEPEKEDDQPFRWTTGSAKLLVPIHGKPPNKLQLECDIPLPGYRVRIAVNGTTLFDETVDKTWRWSADFPLKGVPLGDRAEISIVTSTCKAADMYPGAKDPRKLGILVRELMLID